MKFAVKPLYVYAAGALIVLAGGWLYFKSAAAPVPTITVHPQTFSQQVSVSGTVEAAQNVDLGFAQSGRVSGVYASVGDVVPAGKLLAETENGDLRATLAQKQAVLQSQQATLASLQAGTRPEQIAVTQAQVSSDESALAQKNIAVINAIKDAYTKSDDAVHNTADQFFNAPLSSNPTLTFSTTNSQLSANLTTERAQAEGMLAAWSADYSSLSASSDLSTSESNAQANLAQVIKLLSDANAALNSAIPSSSVSQTDIDGYITDVGTARTTLSTAQIALATAVSDQTSAESTLAKDQKSLALEQAGSTPDDIAAQQAQVAAAQAEVESAQAQLQKTLVVAPFGGTVTRMDAKVGEVVSPTDPQISMISNGLFQIKAYIPEVDVAGVAVGNMATTTLDAYGPNVEFGAKVIAIDPAETMVNGVSTYKTTLQFLQPDPRIKSGMTASVVITTQTSPQALVVPQGAVFERGGKQYVQVLKSGSVVDVPVSTSGSSIGNVQVTSGLSDGDQVILNPDMSR